MCIRDRALLRNYLDQRILFYRAHDDPPLQQEINARTIQVQTGLWSAIRVSAAAQPTPIVALVVSGMNEVLNSQGYTQAALWNRIPTSAWGLMAAIAICCNLLVGYGSRGTTAVSYTHLDVYKRQRRWNKRSARNYWRAISR